MTVHVRRLREKIEALLENRAQGREMGKQGQAKVEQAYAWPTIIPRLEQVYEKVLTNDHTSD